MVAFPPAKQADRKQRCTKTRESCLYIVSMDQSGIFVYVLRAQHVASQMGSRVGYPLQQSHRTSL